MMRNNLFKKSFCKEIYHDAEFIDNLLNQINISENNLKDNLLNIRNDFPGLTDHSLDHSLMLWNYAELIIGDEQYLNPLEAYVLHMCFLIHDAGMCFSILNNKEEIEATDLYKDYVALHQHLENVHDEALFYCVRKLHGEFSLKIAESKLASGKWVIENESLRDEFATIIGKISKSHSCNVSFIENELGIYIKPTHTDWKIDCQKLAFILRVSDAAHLDNLRTPLTYSEIGLEIHGISKEHWIFQKKLGFPTLDNGYLKFISNSPFNPSEKKAWWLCHDALKVLDNELKKADLYFLEANKKAFSAKGVKSVDNSLQLGENYIKTEGWKSVDTNIKVSNPKILAANVGGKNLYNFSYFAIRELIQNSFDAISLRRIKEENFEGKITINLNLENDKYVLQISDNGIGMSKSILCNQLLDFGSSYWNSYDFYDEYVGIAQEKFKSIGKFGIGFFSVFMLGTYIEIDSLKYGEPYNKRNKLVFEHGLNDNPLFKQEEDLTLNSSFGTKVSIVLNKNPYTEGFLHEIKCNTLLHLITHLIPSPICEIEVEELGELFQIEKNVIDDGYKYNFQEILDLTYTEFSSSQVKLIELAKIPDLHLEPILINDSIVGQLGIIPKFTQVGLQNTCLVESNGIRVTSLSNDLVGYIKVKEITNLVRNQYDSGIPYESVYNWGINYLEYMKTNQETYDYKALIDGLKFSLGIFGEDDIISLYIEKKNEKILPLNESLLILFLSNINQLNYYDLMHEIDENFLYDGIIQTIRPFALNGIVSEKDKERISSSFNSYLEKIIEKTWGTYTVVSTTAFDDFPLEREKLLTSKLPYMNKKIYIKQ
ncbi:HD domain-containing protein [Chryseobacterium lathyri]|uniref:HD domain-containing protein n=1 Tax=Chryseobacterium lathyri TaxID=395933 RepID=UPI0027856E80|nr:ATP-binding protein [Chryseobacterium lathyri]MDQ0066771.1 hypothetical protein [Chryseobacterium lathyri]